MLLLHSQFSRFIWTGIFNTINGYAWVLGIQFFTGQPMLANLLGYIIAAAIGYVAHSRYTFRQRTNWRSAAGYTAVLGTSYSINLVVLKWSLSFLPTLLAQILAVTVFSLLCYFGHSRFSFAQKSTADLQPVIGKAQNFEDKPDEWSQGRG